MLYVLASLVRSMDELNKRAREDLNLQYINPSTLKDWWSECQKNHPNCRKFDRAGKASANTLLSRDDGFTMRLIDVTTSRVICAPRNARYVLYAIRNSNSLLIR